MELFNRQKKQSDVPPELQPYYGSTTSVGPRDWLLWVLRIIVVAVIIALIVVGIVLLVHKTAHHNPVKPPAPTIQQSPSSNPKTNTPSSGAPSAPLPNTGG